MDKAPVKKTLKVTSFFDEIEKEEVRKRVDITSLFASFGVELKRQGKSLMGRCPFHDDSTPSLSVDAAKGLYHCFGCSESGDIFDLVMKQKGFSFPEALQYLKGGGFSGHQVSPVQPVVLPQPPVPARAEEENGESHSESTSLSLSDIASLYTRNLYENKEAASYLEGRLLGNRETWKRFSLGYSSGTLPGKLSEAQKTEAKRVGLLTESGREFFGGCIVVPLFDETDQVAGFYGRAIDDSRSVKHLYLPGGHKGLFNRKALSVYREEVILTESIIDALSLIECGIQNVVPCYGLNGCTELHLKGLQENRVQVVSIAFDADETGRKGADNLKAKLLTEGYSVKLVFPQSAKDWNEGLQNGLTTEELKTLFVSSPIEHPAPQEAPLFSVSTDGGRRVFQFPLVSYRLLGVKDLFAGSLKVNIRVESGGEKAIDNVDLYSARSRSGFASSLSAFLGMEAKRIERDLLEILEYLEDERDRKLTADTRSAPVEITPEERTLGMELLTDPQIAERIIADSERLGYVGEENNKLLLYLAATSRKLDDPLSVLVISESGAGKSYLIETIAKLLPREDVLSMTSLSDQALNYLSEDALLHKFLVMGEALHSESVELQIREMLSSHELSRLVTMKDVKTGELSSTTVRKKAIVSAAMSTTSHAINAENASRFFVINADESREQTARIHEAQRKKYTVSRFKEKEEQLPRIVRTHQAAQRLLEVKRIVNPFASLLSFPTALMRTRRDHERFLDLIASVAFLRQYQKEEQEREGIRYIECDLADYRIAYRVMEAALPSTLSGFPESAQALYEALRVHLREKAEEEALKLTELSLSRREIREITGFSQMTVKKALRLLVDYEYLVERGLRVRGSKRGYSLACDEALRTLDLSQIPRPSEMEEKLQNV